MFIHEFDKAMLRDAIAKGWFRYTDVECQLPSGRTFRYRLNDYPFRVDASEGEIHEHVTQVIKDKYRYCQWDRDHPHTDQEAAIFDALKRWMMSEVAKAQQLRSEDEAAGPA